LRKDRDNTNASPQVTAPDAPETSSAPSDNGPANNSNGSSSAATPPAIALPKGGGAIRGIGEKFSANPATGTGSLTLPIPASPARSNFGPQLQLSYDSGSGNGPFGIGWSLSLPSVTRKTDKGLPQYLDNDESDVFIISGAEDLVPVLEQTPGGWVRQTLPTRNVNGEDFRIQRYRPRVEGLFSRIERWTSLQNGESHWRSLTRTNVTTIYGNTNNSRIFSVADADPQQTKQIFSWLVSESYDDKGNAIVYEYAEETDDNVDLSLVNERNRLRTTNRYVKRIRYGNRTSHLVQPDLSLNQWLFELVFDYEEDHFEVLPLDPNLPDNAQHQFVRAAAAAGVSWAVRPDPFSAHRSGFEIRTYRRCRRALMFHRFDELGPEPYLVRSIDFDYADLDYTLPTTIETELSHQGSTRFASFITAIHQSGYVRDDARPVVQRNGINYFTYLRKSMPPVEFAYSKAVIADDVRELDESSVENLPIGIDGNSYQFVDIDGEGVSGVLTEQATNWFYKPNLGNGRFGKIQVIETKPSLANLNGGQQQLLDLAGDGQLDLVQFRPQTPGFYERTTDEKWEPFRPFNSQLNVSWDEPNLRFIDLNGDGHADVLITENDAITWYPSLGEEGFDSARRVRQSHDEEKGPKLVFADGTQSIYLADMCGDGLTDLVRVRNGEVCYWPNLGYGHFGAKVTMDNSPLFDRPDQFNQKRIRLADIDGSGVTDIIYFDNQRGALIFFNQSGNRWSNARLLAQFPKFDSLSSVTTADLLGNGTTCLIWSTSLPAHAHNPIRYIDLMSGLKPHLLTKVINNLGAETTIEYASSTKFYLADKQAGTPWITKAPFPIHVVERIISEDRVSKNRCLTRHSYHHGYFDGVEREFRGFGRVDQLDTEEFAALNATQELSPATNIDPSSHVPPVLTRTWFHTGVYLGRDRVSRFFAGLLDGTDQGEYYREPGLTDTQAERLLLADTTLPLGLTVAEEREACRALKGSMLRQEIYALDGTTREIHPYTVTEQNFTLEVVQPQAENQHGVYFVHPREAINYHYERNPDDPRIDHTITLDVDDFGNLLRTASINYGRRVPDPTLALRDQRKQQLLITYTENDFTNVIDANDDYRTPVIAEMRTFEITGLTLPVGQIRFTFDDMLIASAGAVTISYETTPTNGVLQKRLIEHVRTIYRRNNLAGPLALGQLESLALPHQVYKQAFTPALITSVFGGRVTDPILADEAHYVHSEGDANWWIASGEIFYSTNSADTPAQELAHAQANFFLPHRYRTQFHTNVLNTETVILYDAYHLLLLDSRDALNNRITVGERDAGGNITSQGNDYRVLQAFLVMDPNRNRAMVAFDAFGMVAGSAVMGKPAPAPVEGDSLAGFTADLTDAQMLAQLANPLAAPAAVLGNATQRIIYDLFAYHRTRTQPEPQCVVAYTLQRETHVSDPLPPGGLRFQHGFSYSDGFGREIQKKAQAEPGPVPQRDPDGNIIVGPTGQPVMTANDVSPRWVGSGWTIFNNKGKPVRNFEPFFTDTHRFEFDVRIGVSPTVFYDPVGRAVGTVNPNHTWEKMVFDPWRQETWDLSDTVLIADPRTDADVGSFFARLPTTEFLPTWHTQRQGGALGPQEQAAAAKAAIHANTPTVTHADTLARGFLTVVHNRFKYSNTPPLDPPVEEFHLNRVDLDIEGNQRNVFDVLDRLVMRYDYDMLGNRIHQASMEAGERWMLNDVVGKPLYAFDARDHRLRTAYDALRRPTDSFMRTGAGPELIVGRTVYGELQPTPEISNLRTRTFQVFDQAGVVTTDLFSFKGNSLRNQRQLAQDYATDLDWSGALPLEPGIFTSRTSFDELDRPLELHQPDNSVIRAAFNEAGLLERLEVNLRGEQQNGQPVWTEFVSDIDYDAKGQRVSIDYGNNTRTTYEYDPFTFRMTHLRTQRDAVTFPGDCPQPPPPGFPGCNVQNLSYTYDPVGNVTHIRDDAQQTVYFLNQRVEPSAEYTYDAIYRLIEANGREHLGQVGGSPIPHSYNDVPRIGILHSTSDGGAMGRYLERYLYDAVGNISEMAHRGTDPANPGWTRTFVYDELSQLEPLRRSNRLTSTTIGGSPTETYSTGGNGYDAHGNMLRLPQLQAIEWDFKDEMRMSQRQAVNPADADGVARAGERTFYVYDSGGQRVRKVTELPGGQIRDERIYLGGFEIYRRNGVSPIVRETLHIMDDQRRIALVETRTAGNEPGVPAQLIRFQYDNHLGSAALELDQQAQIISYEEYTPYGSTSYQAVRSQTETPKRYRYCGKERDEESGFSYHNTRYYVLWLGRWLSADPIGIGDGLNLYVYCKNNPVMHKDDSGTDARLTVNQQNNTITYSSTVHFYGSAADIAQFRPASERATQFYQNAGGTVNIDGRVWNVQYDVQFQFHDTASSALPSNFQTIFNQMQDSQVMSQFIDPANGQLINGGLITLYGASHMSSLQTGLRQVPGYRSGDTVVSMQDLPEVAPGLRPTGVTFQILPSFMGSMGSFPVPNSNALMALDRGHNSTEDDLYKTLIHEVGHTLGFDERYTGTTSGAIPHERFEDDFMSGSDPSIMPTFNPEHREASARFGAYVANGRDVNGAALRDFRVDATRSYDDIRVRIEQFSGGALNPQYESLQRRLRSDNWSRFRQQLTPPPPPPPVQIFGLPRDPLGRSSRFQVFPGWNPSSPQTTTVFSGRF
jgi:RHS repeat-associated protein